MSKNEISEVRESIFPLILNSASLVANSNGSRYTYTFPGGSVKFSNATVALGKIQIYYSWFNITADYGNNTYSFLWPTGGAGVTTTFNVTITDGFYDVSALNTYLQQYCIDNDLYLINSSGEYVYYLEFIENPNYYAVQLNTYQVPTALPAGWTAPAGFPAYPTSTYTPQLVVASNAFQDTIGFVAGTYPAAQQTTAYSAISTTVPQVAPVSSVIVTCDLLNNALANPRTVLFSFDPSGTEFGSIISVDPNEYFFVDVMNGNYSTFTVQFLDQNYNQLKIRDTNLVITLLIKTKYAGAMD